MSPSFSETQNDGQVVTGRLYAWVAMDLNGVEGIISAPFSFAEGFITHRRARVGDSGVSVVPLVFGDEKRARRLQPIARWAAQERGAVARLVVFERGHTLVEVPP